jgi:hypothetical protein
MPGDAAALCRVARTVYPLAKAANPQCGAGGCTGPHAEPVGSPAGLNDLLYRRPCIKQAQPAPTTDWRRMPTTAIAPEADPAAEAHQLRRVELLRQIMVRYGEGHRPIFVTEAG